VRIFLLILSKIKINQAKIKTFEILANSHYDDLMHRKVVSEDDRELILFTKRSKNISIIKNAMDQIKQKQSELDSNDEEEKVDSDDEKREIRLREKSPTYKIEFNASNKIELVERTYDKAPSPIMENFEVPGFLTDPVFSTTKEVIVDQSLTSNQLDTLKFKIEMTSTQHSDKENIILKDDTLVNDAKTQYIEMLEMNELNKAYHTEEITLEAKNKEFKIEQNKKEIVSVIEENKEESDTEDDDEGNLR
jgi:hypothetical protein